MKKTPIILEIVVIHYWFLFFVLFQTTHATCPLNTLYNMCGYNGTAITSSFDACNLYSCCKQIRDNITSCDNSSSFHDFLSTLQTWQRSHCTLPSVCEDPCVDPLDIFYNTTHGALNKVYEACGKIENLGEKACTQECCSNMSVAFPSCNLTSTAYTLFDATLTGYQLLHCNAGFTCYPNDKCFDPLGLINSNRGAINRALATCGIPGVNDLTGGWTTSNLNSSCSSTCCTALENAQGFCANSSSNSADLEYQIVSAAFPVWQASICNHTCRPEQCFDYSGLLNSHIGAANRVLRACGAISDVKSFLNFTGNFDPYRACHPACCIAIEENRQYCNSSTDARNYEIFIESIYLYQAAVCNTSETDPYGGPFMCRPNNNCWEPIFGLINSKIGAAHRALAACGAPLSFTDVPAIMNDQLSFNATMACTTHCCDLMAQATPLCNDSSAFSAFDVALTGYQLLECPNSGFTCIPDNKCLDPLGLVNSDRGYLNRALKACGVPDGKTFVEKFDSIPTNTNMSCGEACCLASESARLFCNDSYEYITFQKSLPIWQAKWCYNFTCDPTQCFEAAGLVNSRLGAANRVLRYCGAPSEISSIKEIVDGSFDTSLACKQYCCDSITNAQPYCVNDTSLFSGLVNIIEIHQATHCSPVFLCRPNDECLDPLGLINPQIGLVNNALYQCGLPASVQSIQEIKNLNANNFTEKACSNSCCGAIEKAKPNCSNDAILSSAVSVIEIAQATHCSPVFLCRQNNKCIDPLGLINPRIGRLNDALYQCGLSTTFSSSNDLEKLSDNFTKNEACAPLCCSSLLSAHPYCQNDSSSGFAYDAATEYLYYHQAKVCYNFTCKVETVCYSTLGVINAQMTPLQTAMVDCGIVTDLNHFTWDPSVTNIDTSKVCTTQCCLSVNDAATPCNDSILFPIFTSLLVELQRSKCDESFMCNITATNKSSFSILGLSFMQSVGVVIAIAAGVIILFVILLLVLKNVFCEKEKKLKSSQ